MWNRITTDKGKTHTQKNVLGLSGEYQSQNQDLRQIFKELQKEAKKRPVEDEGVFEDDPRAMQEDKHIYRRKYYE